MDYSDNMWNTFLARLLEGEMWTWILYNNENEGIFQRCKKTILIKYTEELYNRLNRNSRSSSNEIVNIVNQVMKRTWKSTINYMNFN